MTIGEKIGISSRMTESASLTMPGTMSMKQMAANTAAWPAS
jgi:hypothetical protein